MQVDPQTRRSGAMLKPARTRSRGRSGSGAAADPARRRELSRVIADVALRRARGEHLPDAAVLTAHPDLQPELQDELAALRDIHRTFLTAQKAGPTTSIPHDSDSLAARLPGDPRPDPQRLPSAPIPGYAVIGEASAGGQGAVFRAKQETTGRAVAIKVIWGGPLTGSRHRARFELEAQIMARLDHPNIVPILDRGRTADGSLYLVMPFIEGCPLDEHVDRVRSGPKADVAEVLRLFVAICRAVAEAHKQGIIHRDLKPTNVRVDQRGEPHVLDFGLARATEDAQIEYAQSITMTGQIVGSLPWASPEQVSSGKQPLDVRTDVYSLGVMLYQSLCGTFPYSICGSVQDVLNNIVNAEPMPPSRMPGAFAKQIRLGLNAIVLRALSKAPEKRYADAGALADDLERYLNRRRLDRATLRPYRRQWRRYLSVALAAMIPVSVGCVLAWQYGRPDAPRDLTRPQITNSIGMHLAQIPPGRFRMGSPDIEPGRSTDEPLHEVTIDHEYLLGVTEVTQLQYRQIMGSLPSGQVVEGDDIPVHNVSYDDAVAFCRELSKRERVTYRLPTEEEWEWACRCGLGGPYASPGVLDKLGWYKGNSGGRPHPVAGLLPNMWGLYDMHGGVSEWTLDPYQPTPASSLGNREFAILDGHVRRVLRGGSYLEPAQGCRSAARRSQLSGATARDGGLRVVCVEAP